MANRGRPRRSLSDLILKLIDDNKKLKSKFADKAEKKLYKLGIESVKEWYGDYPIHLYKRKKSLFHAFEIRRTAPDEISIHTGPEDMAASHRVSNDYIYENSFERGWHGGADKGPDHPAPGVPYWRTPAPRPGVSPPYYSHWLSPATQSTPPIVLFNKKIDIYEFQLNNQFMKEFTNQIIKQIEPYI